jgi:hypothetical protein
VKTTKIQENLFIEQDKDVANHWKSKAISGGKENNFLRKPIKELTSSQQGWKTKYFALKNPSKSSVFDVEKAARHQYSLAIVRLILEMHKMMP